MKILQMLVPGAWPGFIGVSNRWNNVYCERVNELLGPTRDRENSVRAKLFFLIVFYYSVEKELYFTSFCSF